jgi:8-oxo-dGTP pyrophosphatase MutT (NUDIX family)
MRSEYTEVWNIDGEEIVGQQKVVFLPFKRVSARTIIIRKGDGAILGTLHKQGGRYALPSGSLEDGEGTLESVLLELDEENIHLVEPDRALEAIFAVDYFDGYGELSVWHFFPVVDAHIGESVENIESRWVFQDEDVWYPYMRERLLMEISKHPPHLARKMVQAM